ncbi:MAG TPA: hypothetical protein VE650_15555 [Acetobacteraceae bacterium]|nr:hypothetical protein [Acetobacteraceae bacterium]
MNRILSVAAVLSLTAAVPALAGEGNYDPFPPASNGTQVFSRAATSDTGSEAYAAASGPAVRVTNGDVLPSNSANAIVQTANSLPPGWSVGTSDYAYAQSVNRYFADQARHATQTAQAR